MGPHHLLSEIKAVVSHCNQEEREVLEPIMAWNGFYAHPENVQISLLCSPEFSDRLLGINTILSVRKNKCFEWPVQRKLSKFGFKKGVRPFKVPDINFEANHISELSDLSLCSTEAPLTMDLTENELRSIAFQPLDLKGLPCHTTACERGVQITTSSATVVSDPEMRDGCSYNKIAARERNNNALKKNWKV